jgi:NAD(P)-dependent dehydrogenase (short-subunit alcohol dehydrogenase family)
VSILDAYRLDGKVALVTGVGRGLGKAIAIGLAEAGADIAGLYHTRYEESQAQIEALGRRFLPVRCDLLEATVARMNEVVAWTSWSTTPASFAERRRRSSASKTGMTCFR